MAIERDHNKEITFICDDCGDAYDTATTSLDRAAVQVRSEKWKIKKDTDGEWYHLCKSCEDLFYNN